MLPTNIASLAALPTPTKIKNRKSAIEEIISKKARLAFLFSSICDRLDIILNFCRAYPEPALNCHSVLDTESIAYSLLNKVNIYIDAESSSA